MNVARAAAGTHATTRDAEAAGLNPVAWATWAACALAIVFLTSNPLYSATIVIAALVVYASNRPAAGHALDWVLAFGVALALLTVPLNLLTGSTGETQIVELPLVRCPGWLGGVALGGAVTAESGAYALTQAVGLIAILAVVAAFNVAADHLRLLKQLPAGLAQLGIIVSVGLLLLPETVARASTLREARIVRGHSGRGAGALLAMSLPLLSDALERSVQRAEALDARGFGYLAGTRSAVDTLAATAGLALATGGVFGWYYYGPGVAAAAAIACGCALVGLAAWRRTTASNAVSMRPIAFTRADAAICVTSTLALAAFVAARAAGFGDVGWLPFPRVEAPPFHPLPAAACLAIVAPAAVQPLRSER